MRTSCTDFVTEHRGEIQKNHLYYETAVERANGRVSENLEANVMLWRVVNSIRKCKEPSRRSTLEIERPFHCILFVNLEKTYDRVHRSTTWSILQRYGIKRRLMEAV